MAEPRLTNERRAWWSLEPAEVLATWGVAPESGLSAGEVERRREVYGFNRLRPAKTKRVWEILWNQVRSLIFVLLLAAVVGSVAFAQWLEAGAILLVIALNTLIGFVMELRSVRSMEALRKLTGAQATVRRAGRTLRLAAEQLVPGDMVVLEAGDSISADLRLIECSKLQADESTLTGESVPVEKRLAPVAEETVLAERSSMVWSGTYLTRGSGLGVVVATGMHSELGQIARLVGEAVHDERTPLERRLDALGRELVWITLGITALVVVIGILRGKDLYLMIETGVALAVSAIPEGLPIVATLALARGMLRLARHNVLIRRLAAVETLGATSVICTDKTGTLTENRMTVTRLELAEGSVVLRDHRAVDWQPRRGWRNSADPPAWREVFREAIETAVLCNNASFAASRGTDVDGTGDPIELALLAVGKEHDLGRTALLAEFPEVHEVAFEPETKMMATIHQMENGFRVAVKGAPEHVLNACTHVRTTTGIQSLGEAERADWLERNLELGRRGLRVLGLAGKRANDARDFAYADLTWQALVAMEDPPRLEVPQAIATCRQAGIQFVMITGDQAVTARKIAADIGLADEEIEAVVSGKSVGDLLRGSAADRERLRQTHIFARVEPKDKLDLIALHQQAGAIVAMTGDGVNDAPAIEKADIGVAMGLRGTEVAREAADMVLEDDSLASIVTAVHEGRIIFGNIRKFVTYLLSCNTSEIMVIGVTAVIDAPLPVLPIQILLLNLVTDVFPALALGAGRGERDLMTLPPRPLNEPVLPARHWRQIVGFAAVMTAAVLASSWVAHNLLRLEPLPAVTVSFLTMALTQMWHVFNMRSASADWRWNEISANPFVWMALGLCLVILMVVVLTPGVSDILRLANPGWAGWGTALALSCLPLVVGLFWRGIADGELPPSNSI